MLIKYMYTFILVWPNIVNDLFLNDRKSLQCFMWCCILFLLGLSLEVQTNWKRFLNNSELVSFEKILTEQTDLHVK